MNSQQLLLINLIIILSLVLFFNFRRLKRKQLKKELPPEVPQDPQEPEAPAPLPPQKMKRNQVYFVYNGHEWEAFEVLGLSGDVSLEEATLHYQQLIKTSDSSTFEFYDAAFTCVLKMKLSQ